LNHPAYSLVLDLELDLKQLALGQMLLKLRVLKQMLPLKLGKLQSPLEPGQLDLDMDLL
jgi:hypothetical protein